MWDFEFIRTNVHINVHIITELTSQEEVVVKSLLWRKTRAKRDCILHLLNIFAEQNRFIFLQKLYPQKCEAPKRAYFLMIFCEREAGVLDVLQSSGRGKAQKSRLLGILVDKECNSYRLSKAKRRLRRTCLLKRVLFCILFA